MAIGNEDKQDVINTSVDFSIVETELKSNKDVKITGFISTSKKDSNKDIVTKKGQTYLVSQIKERIKSNKHITMDLDHESFERQKENPLKTTGKILNKIPVALIEDVELVEDGEETKTKVTALINEGHPMYKNIVKSISKGFLHSFSIVYKVTEGFIDKLGNRVIENLSLTNVGITGVPVNEDAGFVLSLKSYLHKMELEEKIVAMEATQNELKSKFDTFEKENTELKSQLKEKNEEITELKSNVKTASDSIDTKIEDLKVSELKSQVEESVKKYDELVETLNELKSKGMHKATAPAVETKTENINVFGLM